MNACRQHTGLLQMCRFKQLFIFIQVIYVNSSGMSVHFYVSSAEEIEKADVKFTKTVGLLHLLSKRQLTSLKCKENI